MRLERIPGSAYLTRVSVPPAGDIRAARRGAGGDESSFWFTLLVRDGFPNVHENRFYLLPTVFGELVDDPAHLRSCRPPSNFSQ